MESQISDHLLYHGKFSPAIPKLRPRGDLPPGPERFLKQNSEKNDSNSSLFKWNSKKNAHIQSLII